MKLIKRMGTAILAVAVCLTVTVSSATAEGYQSGESDIADYKDYIAIELNAELFDSMYESENDAVMEYAGSYIDEFGNYHVCITKADVQDDFEDMLSAKKISTIKSNAIDGAVLNREEIQEIENTDVYYDIKEFSYDYLVSVRDAVGENMDELQVHQVGIKQRDNVVDIYIDNSSSKTGVISYLEDNLEEFDEKAIRFIVEDNNMEFAAAETVIPYAGNEIMCQSGTKVHAGTIGFHVISSWGPGLVTAGHVAVKNSTPYYDGKILGTLESSYLGGTLDCAFISFENTSSVNWEPSYYANEIGTTTYEGISEVASEFRIVEGARTERYGVISGKTYGTIEYTSYSAVVDGTQLRDFILIDDASSPGDSGGFVGLRAKTAKAKLYLLGITSATNGISTTVCKASNIIDQYGFEPYTF